MKQKIDTAKLKDELITDVDVVFTALYNLLYEKIQSEPNKGIVVSKGNPNQRKVKWSEVMKMSHMLEDFFTFREMHHGNRICKNCENWRSVSSASPHMGQCIKYSRRFMHSLHCCKNWEAQHE